MDRETSGKDDRDQAAITEAAKMDEVFSKSLAPDGSLHKCLKNMPAAWLDGICQSLGVERAAQRRDREQQIFQSLLEEAGLVPRLVGELEGPALTLLAFLIYKDGWCPLAVLNQDITGPRGESFHWPQLGAATPAGELISRGLAMAGQSKLNDKMELLMIVPAELRMPVQEALAVRREAETLARQRAEALPERQRAGQAAENHGPGEFSARQQSAEIAGPVPQKPAGPMTPAKRARIQKLLSGCLYYYGAIRMTDLHRLILEIEAVNLDLEGFAALVDETARAQGSSLLIDQASGIVYYPEVADCQKIIAEQQERETLPYRPLNRGEALAPVNEREKRLWTDKTRRLYSWMQEKWPDPSEDFATKEQGAQRRLSQIFNAIRLDRPPAEISQMLFEVLGLQDPADINTATMLLLDMWNDVPMWGLKGWSPAQVRQHYLAEEARQAAAAREEALKEEPRKVGRNDPCPCGSGLKYKKCCGQPA